MNSIKRFFIEDSGTAEATSTVIMIAAVGILLAAGLITWYGNINNFFSNAGSTMEASGQNWNLPVAS
jgi:Flp pilus assembly pilin Flp